MSRAENNTPYEIFRTAEAWIYQVVTNHRNSGLCVQQAVEQAALDLEFSPRRVRAFFQGEAHRLSHDEWRHLQQRVVLHLEKQASYHMRQAEKNVADARRLEALRQETDRLRKQV
jgi:hypothetical protein